MNKVLANRTNITAMWEEYLNAFGRLLIMENYRFGSVPDSDWPNRVWAGNPAHKPDAELKDILGHFRELTYSTFETGEEIQTIRGLQLKSFQYGMSLEPANAKIRKACRQVRLQEVETFAEAVVWSEAFQKAFNYRISPEILARGGAGGTFFLVYNSGTVAGTAMLYRTKGVCGIYSLGVMPEFRGKGIASCVMNQLLNTIMDHGEELIVLQASERAVPLYESLGFQHDFKLLNYQIK